MDDATRVAVDILKKLCLKDLWEADSRDEVGVISSEFSWVHRMALNELADDGFVKLTPKHASITKKGIEFLVMREIENE